MVAGTRMGTFTTLKGAVSSVDIDTATATVSASMVTLLLSDARTTAGESSITR